MIWWTVNASKIYQWKFQQNLKIKSVVYFQKDTQKVKFWSRFGGGAVGAGWGGGVTSKIQTYIFTVHSPCNRRTIVGIESVQHLPYQSM